MFGISESQAYDDIHLCQLMLGNLNAASKEFWRWKVNQEIDEDRKAAKAAGDFRALASMQKNRIKNNRTDSPDEPDLAFDKIVPVEFIMTDDPTVIGLQKIPNLRAKIKKMEKRYSMPDIEDADLRSCQMTGQPKNYSSMMCSPESCSSCLMTWSASGGEELVRVWSKLVAYFMRSSTCQVPVWPWWHLLSKDARPTSFLQHLCTSRSGATNETCTTSWARNHGRLCTGRIHTSSR